MNSKPPDPPVFFIDRCLGKKVADTLRLNGIQAEVHDDHFDQNAQDKDWLGVVGEKKWVVFTKDYRIRYREIEKIAIRNANGRVFTFQRGGLKAQEMADILIKALPKIKRFISKHHPPFIAKVTKSGSVSMLVDL